MNSQFEVVNSNQDSYLFQEENKKSFYLEFLLNFTSDNTRKCYFKDLEEFNQFLVDQFNSLDDRAVNSKIVLSYREYLLKFAGKAGEGINYWL